MWTKNIWRRFKLIQTLEIWKKHDYTAGDKRKSLKNWHLDSESKITVIGIKMMQYWERQHKLDLKKDTLQTYGTNNSTDKNRWRGKPLIDWFIIKFPSLSERWVLQPQKRSQESSSENPKLVFKKKKKNPFRRCYFLGELKQKFKWAWITVYFFQGLLQYVNLMVFCHFYEL